MSGGHGVHIEALAIGGEAAMKAPAIEGCGLGAERADDRSALWFRGWLWLYFCGRGEAV